MYVIYDFRRQYRYETMPWFICRMVSMSVLQLNMWRVIHNQSNPTSCFNLETSLRTKMSSYSLKTDSDTANTLYGNETKIVIQM